MTLHTTTPLRSAPLLLVLATACGGGGGGGGDDPGTRPPPTELPELALELLATDVVFPTFLTSPPGDLERLFVVGREGVIRVIRDDAMLAEPFLDLAHEVSSSSGEQGMFSLAFDPGYATNGRFYVNYTDLAGNVRLTRFLRSSTDPDVAEPTSAEALLVVDKVNVFHNGGQVAFGPDGFLYLSVGDDGDVAVAPQSPGDLLGSLLRIDVAPGSGYAVPPGNPFVGVPGARPEVWSIGLRNPWRFSFDRELGDLWLTDVGADGFEEIDVAPAAQGGGAGANYGWSVMEGPSCHLPPLDCDASGLTPPTFAYPHQGGACSIAGGYVYRGAAIPALRGSYFFSDLCASTIRSFRLQGGQPAEVTTWSALVTNGQIISFGEDAAGELYVLADWGGVFRIVEQPR